MVQAQRAAPGAAGLAVATLPAEIDMANAGRAGEDLRAGPARLPPGARLAPVAPSICQGAAVDDLAPATGTVVVGFPAEIDITNAGDLAKRCREAIAPGVTAVVADLTTTVFCDSSGLRILVLAHDWAKADNVELRLAVPPGPALVVMKLIGLDQLVSIYPGLDQALAGEPLPEAGAAPG